MKVRWEIDDGYVGGDRPQCTEIPNEDLEGLDEEQQLAVVEQYIQEDFEHKASPCWDYNRVQELLAELRSKTEEE
jgi:hypothetical protein